MHWGQIFKVNIATVIRMPWGAVVYFCTLLKNSSIWTNHPRKSDKNFLVWSHYNNGSNWQAPINSRSRKVIWYANALQFCADGKLNRKCKFQTSEVWTKEKNFWVSEAKKFPDELTFVYNNFSEKKSIFEEESMYLIPVHVSSRLLKSGSRKSKNSKKTQNDVKN